MVMPDRLPAPLPVAPEVPDSTVSAACVLAAAKVASAEFTAQKIHSCRLFRFPQPPLPSKKGRRRRGWSTRKADRLP
jgi:hypothetical protein